MYSELQSILLQEIGKFSGQVQDYWPVLDLSYSRKFNYSSSVT